MNIDKKLFPAPKPSYTEKRFENDDCVKMVKITTIDVFHSISNKSNLFNFKPNNNALLI